MSQITSLPSTERGSILLVDPGADVYLSVLRRQFEVTAVQSEDQAFRALRTFRPRLVIAELTLPDGDGATVCRQSKMCGDGPPVLATTAVPQRVPDALLAGCDGVLLKPFPPNLLFARVCRLLRQHAAALQERATWERARAKYLVERSRQVLTGTNIVWADERCPSCGAGGAVSFDAASRRRMWYACLPCRKVWLAPERAA